MSRDAADLLIELGCEELPARFLAAQAEQLLAGVCRRLADAGLIDSAETGDWLATPRRLTARIPAVRERQPDRTLERKGPAENAAFDADGKPTRAAEGFAKSVGLRVDQLERLETDQGRWLFARVEQPGQTLADLLPGMLDQTVKEMAGARSMRWSDRPERFLRPVRWLVVLHGTDVIELDLFGLTAGRSTRGHRIHAPGTHDLADTSQYESVLESARVLADPARRRDRIAQQVETLAEENGLVAAPDPALLDEVANLTEWPVAVIGRFDPEFLDVPPEALVSSMQQHQKCFPLRDESGALSNRFIAVANIESKDPAAMTAGFARVIRPRLADARFFWDADRKQALGERLTRLDEIRFGEKLGSMGDKTRRIQRLATELAGDFGADPQVVRRAAELSKCDLVTDMVGEFPELQGIMGRHYALASGEPEAVAVAIESHYLPRQAVDALPGDPAGQALGLADRLDTLLGAFAAGQKPTGGKDPYALRRAALGMVRILEATECARPLRDLIDQAAEILSGQLEIQQDLPAEVEAFVLERLRSHAAESGIETNTFHAVAAGRPGTIADFLARARAVQAFADDPEAASLIAANKRIGNLLRQAESEKIGEVRRNSLQEDAEKALFDELVEAESELGALLDQPDYPAALARLARLKGPVDDFFDQVMVMAEDAGLRANRLALLGRLRALFFRVADVARLGRA